MLAGYQAYLSKPQEEALLINAVRLVVGGEPE
jgi:DNA-binding NarL/FixJ family response regulator